MCARFELNKTRFQPTNLITFWRDLDYFEQLVWAGFARSEWLKPGTPGLVDIPATRYAERSRTSALLVWEAMPPGLVIRGLIVPAKSDPAKSIVRIVTRAVTAEEHQRFGHDRICVTEPPLFRADPAPIITPRPPEQEELF